MAENISRFIKTVTFGGYERTDVDKRLESLYLQISALSSELEESKWMLEQLKDGTEEGKAYESVLAMERTKLTEVQAANEAMTDRLSRAEENNKLNESEIASLREENEKLKASLEEANSELTSLRAGGDASVLGTVFIEAQKSKDMLIKTAKEEADQIKTASEKLAENIIADADNKAALIIYDAEKRAAEISAEAVEKSEQMQSASQNLKAVILQEVVGISTQINALKHAMESFESEGLRLIKESEQLLKNTETDLKKGGVPVFIAPKIVSPDLPAPPTLKPVDFSAPEEYKKRSDELDKLAAMANAIGGGSSGIADASSGSSKGLDLAALARQAEAIGGGSSDTADASSGSKGLDLAALARQAEAIGGGSSDTADASSKSKGLDLAALAKQAEALEQGKK